MFTIDRPMNRRNCMIPVYVKIVVSHRIKFNICIPKNYQWIIVIIGLKLFSCCFFMKELVNLENFIAFTNENIFAPACFIFWILNCPWVPFHRMQKLLSLLGYSVIERVSNSFQHKQISNGEKNLIHLFTCFVRHHFLFPRSLGLWNCNVSSFSFFSLKVVMKSCLVYKICWRV